MKKPSIMLCIPVVASEGGEARSELIETAPSVAGITLPTLLSARGSQAQLVNSRRGVARCQVGEVMVHPEEEMAQDLLEDKSVFLNLDLLAAKLASSPPRAALSARRLKPPRSRASGQASITGTTLVSLPTWQIKPIDFGAIFICPPPSPDLSPGLAV